MPTLSHTSIVPGTLCLLCKARPENDGAIVEIVRFRGLVPEGWPHSGQKLWDIVCSRPLYSTSFPSEQTRINPAGRVIQAVESMLVPIAGPGLVDEVTAYDKAWQDEKRAVHAVAYGASHAQLYGTASRSTPNVRR